MMLRQIAFLLVLLEYLGQTKPEELTLLRTDKGLPGPSMRFNISLASGVFEFEFKTFVEKAVILYQDDLGISDQILLSLQNGRLKFFFYVSNYDKEYGATGSFITKGTYNDFNWHSVRIERNDSFTSFSVDKGKEGKTFQTNGYRSSFGSPLFFGGFPRNQRTNDLSYPGAFWIYALPIPKRGFFNACVRNIRYGETRSEGKEITKDTLDRINVEDGCKLNYCHKPDPICKNKGRCSPSREHNVTCDCRWTGFTGKTCTKHALELTLNGTYRVIYNSQSISPEKEQYTFRIKTSQENAVLYYAGGPPHHTDFILIEIRSSNMKLVVNFGGRNQNSGTNYNITSPVKIDDDKWHYVSYTKRRDYILLTVDKVISEKVILGKKSYRRMDYGGDCYLGEIAEKPYGDIKIQDFIWEIFRGNEVETVNLVTGCYNKCQMRDKYRIEPVDHLPKYNRILPIFTGKPMSNTQAPNSLCRGGRCSSTGPSETTADPNVRSKNVASDSSEGEDDDDASVTWIIVVTIIVSLLLFAAIVFFVRKWNKRYSGDFQVNKKPIGPAGTIVRYQDAAHKEKQRQMKL